MFYPQFWWQMWPFPAGHSLQRFPHSGDKSDCHVSYVAGFGASASDSKSVLGLYCRTVPTGKLSLGFMDPMESADNASIPHINPFTEKSNGLSAFINNDWQYCRTPNTVWILILTLLLAVSPWTGSSPLGISSAVKSSSEEDLRL